MMVSGDACVEQAECDESQCCAGLPFFGGICQNFTAEGGKCHVEDKIVPIFGDFYIGPCPCAEGLECVQQGKKKNNGICQKPATTTAAPTPAEDPAVDVPADDSTAEDPAVDVPADDATVEEPSADADSAAAAE
ncbi:prokineticin domain-containing protein [Nephila pilipes]|uniref:Prokineticin domain-containing protein n=1 Tax=Nephila pilipes TaxID=299642 RepID=A0A8X6NT44_NEPPI|nr:prokineticin domain-containing protein [Nephila pilipes]